MAKGRRLGDAGVEQGSRIIRKQAITQVESQFADQQAGAAIQCLAEHRFLCVQLSAHAGVLRTLPRKQHDHAITRSHRRCVTDAQRCQLRRGFDAGFRDHGGALRKAFAALCQGEGDVRPG
jgi:hypothetical protein